jgi:hypothetical protein
VNEIGLRPLETAIPVQEVFMYCKRIIFGAVAAMSFSGIAMGEVLISPTVHNGSFELLGPVPGAPNVAKATNWDTDPDGDVTYWTLWDAVTGGPATAFNDSGTENNPTHATNGTKVGFLQANNAAFNLTEHTVQLGDKFKYTWDYALAGRGNITAQLAYQDAGGLIVPIAGTTSTNAGNATVQTGIGASLLYTVASGDPAIGRLLALTIKNDPGTNYPELDNVLVSANLCAGDVDGNCIVNGADFAIIRDHFRQNVASRELGDLTNDGIVSFPDYLEWRANATAGSGAEAFNFGGRSVPEPAGLLLVAIAIGPTLSIRMRRKRYCE